MATTAAKKPSPPLRPALARDLVAAEARYRRAMTELDEAKKARQELIYRVLAKIGVDKPITIAGWIIKITMQSPGERFSLADFRKQYKVTRTMEKFISRGEPSPRLWLNPSK